jgi:hypothetical protein
MVRAGDTQSKLRTASIAAGLDREEKRPPNSSRASLLSPVDQVEKVVSLELYHSWHFLGLKVLDELRKAILLTGYSRFPSRAG